MNRRSAYRRTGQDREAESRQHGRRARTVSRSTRRADRGRSRLRPLSIISIGVVVLSLITGALVLEAAPSEASTTSKPRLIAAMACLQKWLADPPSALTDGTACTMQRPWPRAGTPSDGLWSDDDTASATASEDDSSVDGPSSVASPTDSVSAGSPGPGEATPSALAAEIRATPALGSTSSTTRTPSPSPTATPTATQTAETSSPSPTPNDSASTPAASTGGAFGSGPTSGPISCHGRSGVVIQGTTFRGIGNDQPAIVIDGCSDVVISDNDFIDDTEPIYVVNSTNVRIIGNRYRNITGPHTRNGSHRGNFTQWENSFGGVIRDNLGIGGDTEDVISIYQSGGRSASDPLIIEGNVFKGSGWTSGSGSGIMLGDGGGSHVVVRDNVLIDVGQVGIGVAGGSDIHITGNTIFGSGLPHSNVGLYVWGQGTPCSDIEVASNRIDFIKDSGVPSALWNGGTCGAVSGWSSNSTPDLDAGALSQALAAIG